MAFPRLNRRLTRSRVRLSAPQRWNGPRGPNSTTSMSRIARIFDLFENAAHQFPTNPCFGIQVRNVRERFGLQRERSTAAFQLREAQSKITTFRPISNSPWTPWNKIIDA